MPKSKKQRLLLFLKTHPHADFVSSHLQIHEETGAPVYVSKMTNVNYHHTGIEEGDVIEVGNVSIKALHTPGNSQDSFTFIASEGTEKVLFTGDTLFIGL